MTVELRITAHSDVECDWGVITHARPEIFGRGLVRVAHLILVSKHWVDTLLTLGEPDYCDECVCTVTESEGRKFFTAEAENGRWTWELFPCIWWDGEVPNVYLGRWPD